MARAQINKICRGPDESASATAFHGYELHGRIAKEQDCAGSRPTIHLAAGGVQTTG